MPSKNTPSILSSVSSGALRDSISESYDMAAIFGECPEKYDIFGYSNHELNSRYLGEPEWDI